MGAAIRKNQGVGSPGVGLAHVKRVGGVGAQLPGWLQVVQLVVLVDCSGGVGIVVCEALVDVGVPSIAGCRGAGGNASAYAVRCESGAWRSGVTPLIRNVTHSHVTSRDTFPDPP